MLAPAEEAMEKRCKGVVTGETIIGANFVKDFLAGIRDIVGGRADSYEKVLMEAIVL